MNAWYDFAYTSLHTSLISKIRDILALFSNDNTGLLCGDEGAESDLRCGIFLVRGDFGGVLGDDFLHGSVGGEFSVCGHPDSEREWTQQRSGLTREREDGKTRKRKMRWDH
jgi:hypothetical protein